MTASQDWPVSPKSWWSMKESSLSCWMLVSPWLVKPDLLEVSTASPPLLHAMGESVEPPDMQQLWMDLELEENEFLQQDPLLKKEVWKLISEFRDVFSNSTPGCTDLVELQLQLKPGTQPIRQKFRDLNP